MKVFFANPNLMRSALALAGLSLILTSACMEVKNDENYSKVHSDSGITGRPYAEIVAELKQLESAHSEIAKVITYGKSLGGQDLTMIRIGKPGTGASRPGVLIAGTIHGDEFLNIEDRLPKWFLENQNSPGVAKYLNSGGIIWIAPILNPDGYKARRRENNKGQDLNRDFDLKLASKKGFTQPETTNLYQTIRTEVTSMNAKLNLTLDYHCCVGAIIYPWGHSYDLELPAAEKAEHLRIIGMMKQQFADYGSGRAIEVVDYVAIGASDDFYHETFGARSFTFEGAEGVEDQNFDKHTKMWDTLLADQAGETPVVQPVVSTLRPNLAILNTDLNGALTFGVAGPVGTTSMTLCRGDALSCASTPNSLVSFGSPQQVSDRIVFKATSAVSLNSGEILTLSAKDATGIVKQNVVFRLLNH